MNQPAYQPMNILAALTSMIVNADSYKVSHWSQYPEGTEYVTSYIEARSSQYAKEFGEEYDYSEFFGLQAFMKDYLSVPIEQVDIDIAEILCEMHGEPFNKAGWQYIVDEHGGKLPIEIKALPEGTIAGTSNAMVQIKNTDPECYWLTSYVETAMLRAVWYPTTVATQSRITKEICHSYLDETCDDPESVINFMLHDFGARGVSSTESSAIGGMAHIVNFMGTDTMMGMVAAMRHYYPDFEEFLSENPDEPKQALLALLKKMKAEGTPPPAFSVEASEHSTMTIEGEAGEESQIKALIDKAKEGRIVSIVSDSYDYWRTVKELYGDKFKDDIKEAGANGGRVVIRPDSGDPVEVVIKTLEMLEECYADEMTENEKGYKVLPPYLRVLQGDGIDPKSLKAILQAAKEKGFSAENLVFGMGGGLLQKVNRDHNNFAMKACQAEIRDPQTGELQCFDIFKNPVTADPNFVKKSKRGDLGTIWDGVAFQTKRMEELGPDEKDAMLPVFRDGEILRTYSFDEVRAHAEYFAGRHHGRVDDAPVEDPWAAALVA